ncbi:hypothetical protein GCM10027020_34530 [Nocardioides salsibiostraticola]
MGLLQNDHSTTARRRRLRRGFIAGCAALGVVAVTLSLPEPEVAAGRATSLTAANEKEKADLGLPHTDPVGVGEHDHGDPATKNALARGADSAETVDPTTAAQRSKSAAYVARERRRKEPQLTTAPLTTPRAFHPENRYAMANGCYTLRSPSGAYLKRDRRELSLQRVVRGKATRYTFKATDLGSYLLYAKHKSFMSGADDVSLAKEPSPATDWIVRKAGKRTFTFALVNGLFLAETSNGQDVTLSQRPTKFVLERVKPCRAFPEAGVNIEGDPHAGITSFQEVRGFTDTHTHGMAYEFLGGRAHCGKPWDRYGVQFALVDCPDHSATGGKGAALESVLSGEPSHDPVGWPTFKDWPAPHSLTHEGTYYKWMERAWRGGERLFVNLLVENNQLCQIYPLKKNSCDDMDSIRLQAKRMYQFQDYIDAQFGGPGKGFYRIVKNPWQARKVINSGKMAVIMGIETSVPFGCTFKQVATTDVPACTAADVDRQLTEMHKLGVRQMELVNKFDNALGGVAGDTGSTGIAVNGANFLETGTFWDMKTCNPTDGESSDRTQVAFPDSGAAEQDAIFGAIGQLFGPVLPALPIYPPPLHCNARGLTGLGAATIDGLIKRKMVFDPDHLSVKARQAAVGLIERRGYHGIISSHSWSTPDTYPRILKAGGFITPYAGDSTGFVEKWRRHLGWADKRYYFGFGFGADINGLGAQGDPRGANISNKVTYPFKGINGVKIKRQRAGKRVWDINRDGVAQYGLYPDWVQDLTKVAGGSNSAAGKAIFADMTRGPEAYLQMWERAEGIKPDSCRNPGRRKTTAKFRKLIRPGMSTLKVMRKVGQPLTRLGQEFGYCTRQGKKRVFVKVDFNQRGRVTAVRSS